MKWKRILIFLSIIFAILVFFYCYLAISFNSGVEEIVKKVKVIPNDENQEKFIEFLDSSKAIIHKELEYPIFEKKIDKTTEKD